MTNWGTDPDRWEMGPEWQEVEVEETANAGEEGSPFPSPTRQGNCKVGDGMVKPSLDRKTHR